MPDGRPRIPKEIYLDMQADTIKYKRELDIIVTIPDLITAAWMVAGSHRSEIKKELLKMKGINNARPIDSKDS